MLRQFLLTLAAVVLLTATITAQHQELTDKPETWKEKKATDADSTSILQAFTHGSVHGHFRYFLMVTDNDRRLSDYYANAAGGGLRFETARFYGFQFAISGFYVFNIGSTDLGIPDSLSGQNNRYEIGLFDVANPDNKNDNDRLEELYLRYQFRNAWIRVGKQLLNTPFINLQDGRMRPTGVEGIWTEVNEIKNTRIEGGWLYNMSPRSTARWYSTAQSIGLYSVGLNPDGTRSGYKDNLSTNGVFMVGTTVQVHPKLKVQLWEMYTDNIFNSLLVQADYNQPLPGGFKLTAAAQAIRQDGINDGGNADPQKTYYLKGGYTHSFGARVGLTHSRWQATLNYNRITDEGRYIMPREWGRDPFFTFMPRERNEGLGNVHAFTTQVKYTVDNLQTSLTGGYYQLPDVKDFRVNKYGMPSYAQFNLDVRYALKKGLLRGLELQLLIAAKLNRGETYDNLKYVINKVNMVNYNFLLNYHF